MDQLTVDHTLGAVGIVGPSASKLSRAVGVFEAIAYVDVNAGGDMMKFAENVALGRGIPVRLFATVAGAGKWLENPWH